MSILAIAAHPDDAVLSYGATLARHARHGDHVVVFTVFAGRPVAPYSPAALVRHSMWELHDDPMGPRLDEDRSALAALGATAVHGDFQDAIYRKDSNDQWLVPADGHPQGELAKPEPELVARIADEIQTLIDEHSATMVLTGAGIGDHVDHIRARDATIIAAARTGTPLRLWEDLPYALSTTVIPALPGTVVLSTPRISPVDTRAWQARVLAMRAYKSQLDMLSGPAGSIFDQLEKHARHRGTSIGASYAEMAWPVEPNQGVARTRVE